jgi:hypothetical protein
MNHALVRPVIVITCAILLLTAMASHYAIATTFPIGGDAASYIRKATAVLSANSIVSATQKIARSQYPLAITAVVSSAALPLSWPERYVTLMVLAQICVGLGFGWFLWRVAGWPAAALGIAFWSLSLTEFNPHFEDGTLAQLASLLWLLLFLERVVAGSPAWAGFFALAALATHPLTGVLLIASLILSLPGLWLFHAHLPPARRQLILVLSIIVLLVTLFIFYLMFKGSLHAIDATGSATLDLKNSIRSRFGPIILLAVPGWFIMQKNLGRKPDVLLIVNSLIALSVVLSLGNLIGLDLWTIRFRSYFVMVVTILAAIALPILTDAVWKSKIIKYTFCAGFISAIAVLSWQYDKGIYHRYESPSSHLRLHPDEAESMTWMRNNLPPNSFIATSYSNRHVEWIPILANVTWDGFHDNELFWRANDDQLQHLVRDAGLTHVAFFTYYEGVDDRFSNTDEFPIVFKNNGVTIIRLPKP